MRISQKYIFVMVAVVLTTCLTIIFSSVYRERESLLGQIGKKGRVLSEVAAMSCINPLLNHDYGTLRLYLQTMVQDEDVLSVAVTDVNGIIKMHSDLDMLGEKSVYSDSVMAPGGEGHLFKEIRSGKGHYYYEIIDPIEVEYNRIGFIHLSLSGESAVATAEKASNVNFIIGFLAMALGILSASALAGRISRPIIRLARVADEISHGDLDIAIDIKARDEIGVLVEALEYMKVNLKKHIETRVKTERFIELGRLSSVLAHEIRNPLEPIKGSAQVLSSTFQGEPLVQKFTGIIEEEVNNLSSFLNNFLDYSKPFEPEPVLSSVNTIIENVLVLSEPYIKNKKIKLEVLLAEDLPRIYIDPKQIKQVLMNLILNAVQAQAAPGGLVRISTEIDDHRIHILLYDTGEGIGQEELTRIFEPYFSTKEEGAGLGLTTCYNIIKKNCGTISVESEKNSWTRVTVSFPAESGEKI